MNQQEIYDRVQALNEEAARLRREAFDSALQRQQQERIDLQEQCGKVGHIFVSGHLWTSHHCPFCGQVKVSRNDVEIYGALSEAG